MTITFVMKYVFLHAAPTQPQINLLVICLRLQKENYVAANLPLGGDSGDLLYY